MDYPLPVLKSPGFVSRGAFVALAFLVTSFSLLADTRYSLRTNSTGACYCHCPVAKAHSGCAKMCETPKFASRWWATSCARPRRKAPVNNPGAGPRLPHPDHAEHAQLQN